MSRMHEVTFFVGVTPRRGLFLFDIAPTREIEYPWRVAKRCLLIHFWPGKALVIGRWKWSGMEEDAALLAALEGDNIGTIQQVSFAEKLRAAGRGLSRSSEESSENEHPRYD